MTVVQTFALAQASTPASSCIPPTVVRGPGDFDCPEGFVGTPQGQCCMISLGPPPGAEPPPAPEEPIGTNTFIVLGLGVLAGFGIGWYARQFTPGP